MDSSFDIEIYLKKGRTPTSRVSIQFWKKKRNFNELYYLLPHYTWYTNESWLTYPNGRAFTNPLRGPYDSGDSYVTADQNDEKIEYGIGVDVVSWWGPEYASYDLFRRGYLEASNFEDRKFCLYEITGRLREGEEDGFFNFDNPYNIEK